MRRPPGRTRPGKPTLPRTALYRTPIVRETPMDIACGLDGNGCGNPNFPMAGIGWMPCLISASGEGCISKHALMPSCTTCASIPSSGMGRPSSNWMPWWKISTPGASASASSTWKSHRPMGERPCTASTQSMRYQEGTGCRTYSLSPRLSCGGQMAWATNRFTR